LRYIRTKTSIAKIFDGYIEDPSEIKGVLESLKSHEIDARMRLNDEQVVHSRVRIVDVGDDIFQFQIIGSQSSLLKSSQYLNIAFLEVGTNDEYMIQTKPGITRWNLINPVEEVE
jgi:hypothetical protein